MIFLLLTLIRQAHTMELQYNGQQGRDPAATRDAEGANLEQANPDETLRQKDPVSDKLWKTPVRDEPRLGYRRCKFSWIVR